MKTKKILFYMATAAAVAFTACKGGKPDDAVLAEMSQFEADWGKANSDLKNWGATLATAMADTKGWMDSACTGECKKDEKAKCDSIKGDCDKIQTELKAVETTYNEAVAAAEADGKNWTEWADKAKKGEVKADDLTKNMDDWNMKLEKLKGDMASWNTKVDELKKQCQANCEGMKACCETKKGK